jgi:hypothetical protein
MGKVLQLHQDAERTALTIENVQVVRRTATKASVQRRCPQSGVPHAR